MVKLKMINLGIHKLRSMEDLDYLSRTRLEELNSCGKVVLSEQILVRCTTRNGFPFPLVFKIETIPNDNETSETQSLMCGVSTFEANRNEAHLPSWMMSRLSVYAGEEVNIYVVSQKIPRGSGILLQPMTSDFLEISNPKTVLERGLLSFTCISDGDTFPITYNERIYHVRVTETRPARTILLTDCDLEVEFMAPADHNKSLEIEDKSSQIEGRRIDGLPLSTDQIMDSNQHPKTIKAKRRGSPDHNFKKGSINFCRPKTEDSSPPSFEERRRQSHARHELMEKQEEEKEAERTRLIIARRARRLEEIAAARSIPVITRNRSRQLLALSGLVQRDEHHSPVGNRIPAFNGVRRLRPLRSRRLSVPELATNPPRTFEEESSSIGTNFDESTWTDTE
jgi:ubiquitin fusion degradation protein 1